MRLVLPSVLMVIALFIISSGCTNTTSVDIPPVQTTVTTTTVSTILPTTVPTISPITLTTTAPVQTSITTEDINLHFIDLAFGGGNVYLQRFPYSPKLVTISIQGANPSDITTVESFILEFNQISQSTKLFENVKEGKSGDIVIQFVPSNGMDAFDVSLYGPNAKECHCGNMVCAKVIGHTIYLNSDLSGLQRVHMIKETLLFSLGFRGESLKYPDSMFYYGPNNNTELSFIDQKAVQIMYGSGMYSGMTVEEVRQKLFFK